MKTVKKNNLTKLFMALLLIASVSVFIMPLTAKAAATHTAHKGHKIHEGWEKIDSADDLLKLGINGGNGYLACDIELTFKEFEIYSGKEVNLCLNGYKISAREEYYIENDVYIQNNASLNLYDEKGNTGKITHSKNNNGRGVKVDGSFKMFGGSISNNTAYDGGGVTVGDGTFTMNGGIISNNTGTSDLGGAVCVYSAGTFILNDGKITNNNSVYGGDGAGVCSKGNFTMNGGSITDNSGAYFGGGISNIGTFIMNDGSISGNSCVDFGGGVCNKGSFTMNGGTISGNSGDGGGVYNEDTFVMNGGSITENTGGYGGGVYSKVNFTMKGGKIYKNKAEYTGGGIYLLSGSFTMKNGEISGNYTEIGGGVAIADYAEYKTIFTLEEGNILDNTATRYGGGIYALGKVIMNGGNIKDNTAKSSGGGVETLYEFTMTDGNISGNTSGFGGGIDNEGRFTLSGGNISDNKASKGGGIRITGSMEMKGGSITGNIAENEGGGIYNISNGFYMEDGIISGNKAGENGGGIYTACAMIKGGQIKENSAGQDGIYIYKSAVITEGIVSDTIGISESICKITFNPNKGSGKKIIQYFDSDDFYYYYYPKFYPNTFTRSGYTFLNWNTKADGSGTSYADEAEIKFSKNKTVYAQWAPSKYTVNFDANGGSGSMSSQSIKYNTSTALKKNTFTRKGYEFGGWNTKADGSGTSYADEAQVKLKIYNVNKVTLFAQWSPITASYKVEHYRQKVDGSYPATANETEALTGKTNASITPEVKTYKGFTAPAVKTAKIKADGSLVVKYYYTRNSYKLTWDFAGGKASGSYTKGTVKYGAKITAPVPVRDGYVFTGWDKTVPAKMPANNVTYKAKWRKLTQEEQVRNFVERFYTIILDRPAEAAGLKDWTNRLISKTATGSDVAAGFINSDEFQKKKMTDEEYVTKLYRAFFDREPDKAGYEGWLKELKNGKSRDYVLRGFINSVEFNNLCKKYGINAGSY